MADARSTVYDFSAQLLDGTEIGLDRFRGHVLLIVNTASRCGFTPQYEGLQALYHSHKERGFEVLGFPSNQFAHQEPGTAEEIGAFCRRNYGVSFPMFAKIDVNGRSAHPLYRFLRKQQPGRLGSGMLRWVGISRIGWNFTKFLVDRNGSVVARYGPAVAPKALLPEIERLLATS